MKIYESECYLDDAGMDVEKCPIKWCKATSYKIRVRLSDSQRNLWRTFLFHGGIAYFKSSERNQF